MQPDETGVSLIQRYGQVFVVQVTFEGDLEGREGRRKGNEPEVRRKIRLNKSLIDIIKNVF